MRPVFSKVIPTASGHGPEIMLSVNPGGTVAAKRLPPEIIPHAAATNHVIAASRLIRRMQPAAHPMRQVAQITRGLRPFLSMNVYSLWAFVALGRARKLQRIHHRRGVASSVVTVTARRSSGKKQADGFLSF
jgi:hypothetical protein